MAQAEHAHEVGEWYERIGGPWTEDFLRVYQATAWKSDYDEVYETIVDNIKDIMDAEEVHVHLFDAERNVFFRRASRVGTLEPIPDGESQWGLGHGRSALLFADRKPQILDFVHPHPNDVLPYDEHRHAVTFPLIADDQTVFGICTVTYYEKKHWTQADLDYLSIIGCIIGHALSRLRVTNRAAEYAVLTERKRLSSEIHDNVVQYVHALSLKAATALASLEEGNMEQLKIDLERMEDTCKQTVKVFRDEMLSLRVPLACDRAVDMEASVRKTLESFEHNWGIACTLVIDAQNEPPFASTESCIHLTRILNESLSNILRHSEATMVTVRIKEDDVHLVLSIEDNGHGFDVNEVLDGHWGIKIMQERIESIFGELEIESDESGTTVTVDIPRFS